MNQLNWFIGFHMNPNHLLCHNYYTTAWLDPILAGRFENHWLNINHFQPKHLIISYTEQFTYITHCQTTFDFYQKKSFSKQSKAHIKSNFATKNIPKIND